VVLLNSNPATIMTDPEFADRTYIEPLTPEIAERIIARERPDALLPTLGGQTALNLSVALAHSGVLAKYGVRLIGASLEAIETAEDRREVQARDGGGRTAAAQVRLRRHVAEAVELGEELGYPLVIRASFTLGGLGSGLVHDRRQLREVVRLALSQSGSGKVLIEECLLGWKEFELEVMRDRADNVVIVCSIENFDPLGVHTGDSITVAPAQTLSDVCYQDMRDAALRVMRAIKVEAGGSNIQFAVNPANGEMRIIEMNPRVSRSSALASKATGFPIAKIAALLAAGPDARRDPQRHHEEDAGVLRADPRLLRGQDPALGVREVPCAETRLGTRMKSVGEVMAIGRTVPRGAAQGLARASRSAPAYCRRRRRSPSSTPCASGCGCRSPTGSPTCSARWRPARSPRRSPS
jgi:carbamoyl-phosphate synthase large subunit